MEESKVIHQTINGKYRIVIERAASTKGTLGYKVEANGDRLDDLFSDIAALQAKAEHVAGLPCDTPPKAQQPQGLEG